MGKYVLIEGKDIESFIVDLVLMPRDPINIFRMNEDHIAAITFRVCMRIWSISYVITNGMI
jgi:hypothetical protein